jgi:DNA-binding Lrp family transcriptional regulator
VLRSLREVEGIREVYSAYGVIDIVAKVEAGSIDELKDIMTFKIRRLSEVRTTLTMIVIK